MGYRLRNLFLGHKTKHYSECVAARHNRKFPCPLVLTLDLVAHLFSSFAVPPVMFVLYQISSIKDELYFKPSVLHGGFISCVWTNVQTRPRFDGSLMFLSALTDQHRPSAFSENICYNFPDEVSHVINNNT